VAAHVEAKTAEVAKLSQEAETAMAAVLADMAPIQTQLDALNKERCGPCHRAGVIACRAALRVCERAQRHRQALQLLRAMRRHATVQEVVTSSAAIGACEKGAAVPAGRASLTRDATASGYRAGCDHARCLHQCMRKGPVAGGPYTSCERRSTVHRAGGEHPQRSPRCVREGSAVPAGLAPPTHGAAPCLLMKRAGHLDGISR